MYDLIVIGGGHAGVEAALAASRMDKKVAIVTMDASKLALMSCNPAIGGVGKSHVVKEIDALGGIMGEAIDATGIQFRRLNLSRGPAVWSTRVQADRVKYNQYIVDFVNSDKNVEVIEALAGELLVKNHKIEGIKTESGEAILSKTVIIASGTFLGGLIHIGEKKIKAGRFGENAAYKLSESLKSIGFKTGRLKTGTPPRIDGRTIDWNKCEIQPGHEPIPFFSSRSRREPFKQTPCYLTYTSEKTKEIISTNFHRSPIFSGQVDSTGPRYCPSIEDKFYRFKDKDKHQLFLEPEGNGTDDIYPNGFSTSLPEDIQRLAIRSVIGMEEAIVTRPGYAVEYDYCPANQIKPTMETRLVQGLFLAGQINGTSGYEEAAGQGLMAGINAVLYIEKEKPFILDRSEAYIGVMIDDITTRSTTEPYRLFTSRAEYRLAMREDNTRDRLMEKGEKLGLLSGREYSLFVSLQAETSRIEKQLPKIQLRTSQIGEIGKRFIRTDMTTLENLVRQPGLSISTTVSYIEEFAPELSTNREAIERAIISVRYSGYVEKQQREIDKFKKLENEKIPSDFDYSSIVGLKTEAKEKFTLFRPSSLGQAGRIEGVTPGDVSVLSIYLTRIKSIAI